MAKPISKITVQCPHCGAEQLEPELAKSTFCRRCSQYFAITLAASGAKPPESTARAVDKPRPSYLSTSPVESAEPAMTSGFKSRFGEFLSNKPKQRVAQCFECNSAHEVSSTATSSTCKACGAYIDLQDYKINSSFSRNIKTRVICTSAPRVTSAAVRSFAAKRFYTAKCAVIYTAMGR